MMRYRNWIWVAVWAAILFLPGTARSRTVRVDSAAQLQTLELQPGDTVVFRNGDWFDQQLLCKGEGTEERPVVFRAEVAGKVALKGNSTLRIDGRWLVVEGLRFCDGFAAKGHVADFSKDSEHCRLTQTSIVDFSPPDKKVSNNWISLNGRHNRVDHCYLAGKTNTGPTLVVWLSDTPNYHRIDHNYFGERPPLGENGGETIRIGTSTWSLYDSHTVVEHNYFERCNGELEIISNKSCHNIFRYNTFWECRGTLTLRHGNFARVYGNFFLGNNLPNTGGIRIIGEDHLVYHNYLQDLTGRGPASAICLVNAVPDAPLNSYWQVKRAQVVGNTIVNCAWSLEIGTGVDSNRPLAPENCLLANNLVQAAQTRIAILAGPVNLTLLGNLVSAPDAEIPAVEGVERTGTCLQQSDDGLWRPAPGSPVIGAFKGDFPFLSEDLDGQPRSYPKDVGADQLSTGVVKNKPLTPASVGPRWMQNR